MPQNIIQSIPEIHASKGIDNSDNPGWLIITNQSLVYLRFLESKQIKLYENQDYDYSDMISSYSIYDLDVDEKNEQNLVMPLRDISEVTGVYRKSGFLSKMSFVPSSFLQIKYNGKTYIFAKFTEFSDSKSSGLMGGAGRQFSFESFDWQKVEDKIKNITYDLT